MPFLSRVVEPFTVLNYSSEAREIILRPRYLFWLFIYGLRTSRIAANLAAFVKSHRAPIVLTMDNFDIQLPDSRHDTSLLEEVSRLVKSTKFFLIQHGQELRRFSPSLMRKRVTLLCFGDWVADNFPKFGRREMSYISVGALINGHYEESRPTTIERKQELCLLSTVKNETWWGEEMGDRRSGYEQLVKFLKQFSETTKIRINVALTVDRDQNPLRDESLLERNWFLDRLGSAISFTEPETRFGASAGEHLREATPRHLKDRFATYFASDCAQVTIGMCSTSLWESFARGNKILAVNSAESEQYNFPISGIWFMRKPSYREFEQRLNEILAMSYEEWHATSKPSREYLVMPRGSLSVDDRIASELARVLRT